MIIDRDLQRPKGFGFATFEDDTAADKAVLLNGKELGGRSLRINLAQGRQGGFSGDGGAGGGAGRPGPGSPRPQGGQGW